LLKSVNGSLRNSLGIVAPIRVFPDISTRFKKAQTAGAVGSLVGGEQCEKQISTEVRSSVPLLLSDFLPSAFCRLLLPTAPAV